ncbi:MAG: peptidoglycan DD-metalloendopeptidase family protein [Clostridiales bacterium]|nr:peptidoglycan DD-metalloendopeptidase family protein [Clostridiales bacterium]
MLIRKRVVSLLCAALMLMTMVYIACPTKTYAADYDQQLEEARKEQAELEKKIEAIQADKDKVLEQKALMDQRNDRLRKQVSLVQKQLDETTARIKELKAQEEEQYELFCKQIRQEEERGPVSYWSVIFKATSFADLLGRMDFINEVMEYDRNVMEQLRATREQLAMDQEALEEQKAELISTQQEMEEQIAAAEALIKEYESTEAGMQAMHEQAEEDEARILALIKKANSQNSGSSGGSSGGTGTGGYIWPTNSTRYVTSPYGYRICPFHGKEYHNGADIGAPYGSPVLAPKSGTVIQAGWNGGYGISVMIDHHDGIVTLFGHMCDRNVSEGQQVVQGQVIGWCGSTGNSDGPHIHYTMYKNGAAIDPLPYLPGYIAYDW